MDKTLPVWCTVTFQIMQTVFNGIHALMNPRFFKDVFYSSSWESGLYETKVKFWNWKTVENELKACHFYFSGYLTRKITTVVAIMLEVYITTPGQSWQWNGKIC